MDVKAIVYAEILKLSPVSEITHDELRLYEDLGLDSLSTTRLIVALEEKIGAEIDMMWLATEGFDTVDAICRLAQRALEQA
jgi:acyl carrier protein